MAPHWRPGDTPAMLQPVVGKGRPSPYPLAVLVLVVAAELVALVGLIAANLELG
jgi:hypothetical protein